jgi:hypothetical protein
MRKTIFLFMLAIPLVFVQCSMCKKKRPISNASEANAAALPADQAAKKIASIDVRPDYTWPGATDPFTLNEARVEGDDLIVTVTYGGGCKDHVFQMHTKGQFMKSMPPQLSLYIEHENNDDNCRALKTETLVFDLKNCRNPSAKEVKLIINDDREKMVSYTY